MVKELKGNQVIFALAGMAQLVGCRPAKWKVASLILGQGTSLGFRPSPQLGCVSEVNDQCFSHTLMFLSLSLSLPSPLSKNKFLKDEAILNTESSHILTWKSKLRQIFIRETNFYTWKQMKIYHWPSSCPIKDKLFFLKNF